jgi:hypothetical protein
VESTGYEIDVNGQRYDSVTVGESELPEGAEIKIRKVGKTLKRMYLFYEDKEFPMIS